MDLRKQGQAIWSLYESGEVDQASDQLQALIATLPPGMHLLPCFVHGKRVPYYRGKERTAVMQCCDCSKPKPEMVQRVNGNVIIVARMTKVIDDTPVPHPPLEIPIEVDILGRTELDAELTAAIFGPVKINKPRPATLNPSLKLSCSYCGREMEHIEATHAVTRNRPKRVDEHVLIQGLIQVRSKTVFSTGPVEVCPDCVGMIKPVLDSKGNMVNHGVKIPNSD